METIFTVGNEDLGRLPPDRAVDLFRELLWAEATATGIGKNLINVPSAITVADGGIDADVADAEPQCGQGLIKKGMTRYQIKTGSFSLSGDSDINAILFRSGSTDLKPRVKSCLDLDGTLVVVLFGSDNPDSIDNQAKEKIRQALTRVDKAYASANVEIWRQNHLRGFLSRYPSLALRVTGRDSMEFQSHASWSSQEEMSKEFQGGEAQRGRMETLRGVIRGATSAVHVRICGEAGIGKTRLALEATRADDLAPRVVYCESASRFRNSALMNELLKEDNSFSAIVVVDECDSDARSYIWDLLKNSSNRISLVTLYGEFDQTTGDISYIDVPPLEEDQVVDILQGYGLLEDQARRFSELCSGSPRVAHVLGTNLRNNPQDLLRPLDTVNVWARYIQGGDAPVCESVQQRTLVLRYISLFKRFGFGKPLLSEAQAISRLVQEADSGITWARFQEITRELCCRRILQGETTLYVTPKALHVWLWLEWWETYGDSFDYDEFSKNLTPQLLEWFMEMFRYAAGSPATSGVVRDLLGPNGPFSDEEFLRTLSGSYFFLRLSEGDPRAALDYLKRTVATWDRQRLLDFTEGRMQVVWALQNIAVWRDLFCDAALILLALGEAENEFYFANNASAEFTKLFSVGPGPVASTEAPPEERWPILVEALCSSSTARQRLAINACQAALNTDHWSRLVGPENQGLRRSANLWVPETYGELWSAYRRAWTILRDAMDDLAVDDRSQALDVLLQRGRGLATIPDLADMVISGIRDLITKPYADEKKILEHVIQVLQYESENLTDQTRRELEEVRDELTGDDFSSRMKRYVAMDLLEDQFDEKGNHIDHVKPTLEELAQESLNDKELLRSELDWLVTDEAQNGFRFGYELGSVDTEAALVPLIQEAQELAGPNGTLYFMGGYLRALREADSEGWEKLIDSLAEDEGTRGWVPELTLRSSALSDRSAARILSLVQSGVTPSSQLQLFVFGGQIRNLSREVFQEWIEYQLSVPDENGVVIALDLYEMYYKELVPKGPIPKDQTLELLTHDSLFRKGSRGRLSGEDYEWSTIAEWFLEAYPELSLVVGEKMLRHLGEDGTIVEGSQSRTRTILSRIAFEYPKEVWSIVSELLGPPIDEVAYCVQQWLRGEDLFRPGELSMIEVFPADGIWKWVDGDPDMRTWYLATFVPPRLFANGDKNCLARELLIRFGDRDDVKRNLRANFSTEGWSGPMSLHLESKKAALLDRRGIETEPNVIRWIDEYVEALDAGIAAARIEEERQRS